MKDGDLKAEECARQQGNQISIRCKAQCMCMQAIDKGTTKTKSQAPRGDVDVKLGWVEGKWRHGSEFALKAASPQIFS